MNRLILTGAVGVAVLICVLISGCQQAPPPAPPPPATPGKVSLAQFQQLHEGMTYAEAVKVMGGPGKAVGSATASRFRWENTPSGYAEATFQDGKLTLADQEGLQ